MEKENVIELEKNEQEVNLNSIIENSKKMVQEFRKTDVEKEEDSKSSETTNEKTNEDDTKEQLQDDSDNTSTESNANESNSEEKKEIEVKEEFKPITLKYRGNEITVNTVEELTKYAQKGLGFEENQKSLKDAKNLKKYVDDMGINLDDLREFAELKKGNKDAIKEIAKKNNIDLYDLDDTKEYKPTKETVYTEESAVEEVASKIVADNDLAKSIKDILVSVPEDFKQLLFTDAEALGEFAFYDVKTGLAKKVIPEALKRYALSDMPTKKFVNFYIEVSKEEQSKAQTKETKKEPDKENREKGVIDGKGTIKIDKKDSIFNEDIYSGNKSIDEIIAIQKKKAEYFKTKK